MSWSNPVSVSIERLPTPPAPSNKITVHRLTVNKTTGHVGDTFSFTDHIEGTIDRTRYYIKISVYVNNSYKTFYAYYPTSNSFKYDYTFSLKFNTAGKYIVKCFAEFIPVGRGIRTVPRPIPPRLPGRSVI